jgi:hypothetical protein
VEKDGQEATHGFTVCCKEALEGDGAQKTGIVCRLWMMVRVVDSKSCVLIIYRNLFVI